MQSTRYSCSILMKIKFSRQIFEKYSNVKFYENPSIGSRVVPYKLTGRWIDIYDEASNRFCNFAKAPNKEKSSRKLVHHAKYLIDTRVGTLIVATIYLQLIQNRYKFRSFTVLQCSHQHCVQPVPSDVEVVG